MLWFVFFILALLWVFVVLVHVMLELNSVSRETESLAAALRKHYGLE